MLVAAALHGLQSSSALTARLLAGMALGTCSFGLDLKGMGHETCFCRSVGCYFFHITM